MASHRCVPHIVLALTLVVIMAGFSFSAFGQTVTGKEPKAQPVVGKEAPKARFPLQVGPPRVSIMGPDKGYPAEPVGVTNFQPVETTPISGRLTAALAKELRELALGSPFVREALGGRFVYLDTHPVEARKPTKDGPDEALSEFVVSFYSYSSRATVWVRIRSRQIIRVEKDRRAEPAESQEEVSAAVELAKSDSRLADRVKGMNANGILTSVPRAVADDRIIYVTFSEAGSQHPRFYARVNMTDRRILSAGEVSSSPQHH